MEREKKKKKKGAENQNPFERWTFKLFKKASIDDANDTPRRELIWNEGTNQRTTHIYTTLPSARSHRFVTVRDWPLSCAPTPHWSRGPRGSAYFLPFNPALISLSPTEDAFFSLEMSQQQRLMHASSRKLSRRYFLAQISVELALRETSKLPLMNFNFANGCIYSLSLSLSLSLSVCMYVVSTLPWIIHQVLILLRKEIWKLVIFEWQVRFE